MYLPSIGYALMIEVLVFACLYHWKRRWNAVILYTFSLLFIVYPLFTVKRNMEFADPVTFWQREANYSPQKLRPLLALMYTYIQNDEMKNAAALLIEKKIDIQSVISVLENPGKVDFLLRVMISNSMRLENVVPIAERQVKTHPRDVKYLNTLQLVYLSLGEHTKAKQIIERTLRIDPNHQYTLFNQAKSIHSGWEVSTSVGMLSKSG